MVRLLLWLALAALVVAVGRQTAPGQAAENALRFWSDRLMARFLQITSQFESQG